MAVEIETYLQRFTSLQSKRAPFEPQFNEIAENIFIRKADFTSKLNMIATKGGFLTENLFDLSAMDALDRLSNVLLSDIWDKGVRSFKLNPPEEMQGNLSEELTKFYNLLNIKKNQFMGHNEARLDNALIESMYDECGFGTGGIAVVEQPEDDVVPFKYQSWDIKTMYIDVNDDGIVDVLYRLRETTVRRLVMKYGLKAVCEKVRKQYEGNKFDEKVQVLEIIEPRKIVASKSTRNNKNKPFASVHIDFTNKHLMKESGYNEFPIVVSFFQKLGDEDWGRSPSFLAIPTVRDINILAESIIRAQEKLLDPPLAILDDGTLGRGTVDTSAGAISTVRFSGRLGGQKPIFPINTVGELQSAYQRLSDMIVQIAKYYKLDKLLDEDSKGVERSALGSAIKEGKGAKAVFGLYNKQESDKLTPLIDKSLSIILRRGLVGVKKNSLLEEKVYTSRGKEVVYLPDEIVRRIENGEDIYEIQYLTPARRKRDVEDAEAIFNVTSEIIQIASVDPSYADYYDMDGAVKHMVRKSGVPAELLRSDDAVKAARQSRAQAMDRQRQIEEADKAADIGVKNAQTMAVRNKAARGAV